MISAGGLDWSCTGWVGARTIRSGRGIAEEEDGAVVLLLTESSVVQLLLMMVC